MTLCNSVTGLILHNILLSVAILNHFSIISQSSLDCDLNERPLHAHAVKLQPPEWMLCADIQEIGLMCELILNGTGTAREAPAKVEASLWPCAFISPWRQGIRFL